MRQEERSSGPVLQSEELMSGSTEDEDTEEEKEKAAVAARAAKAAKKGAPL